VTGKTPEEVRTATTVISFLVSVPVLSVQMTPTEPSVSTAGSCRMIAFWRAMACTPSASVIVVTEGRPSGMMATATPTHSEKAFAGVLPRTRYEMRKVASARKIVMPAIHWPKVSSESMSGVVCASTDDTSVLILPSSAASPVAMTTPVPWPYTTMVPPKAQFLRSPSCASAAMALVTFSTATDSPVRTASITCRLVETMRRRSAGMRSPDWTKTRSPGTSSSASTVRFLPSRITVAVGDIMALIASAAFSALPSCAMPMATLMTTTATMRPTSGQAWKPASTAAAPMRTQMSALLIWSQRRSRKVFLATSVILFGP